MNTLEPVFIQCPYCGESVEILVDCSIDEQEYVEDCQVCCRPMVIVARVGHDGLPQVEARRDDE